MAALSRLREHEMFALDPKGAISCRSGNGQNPSYFSAPFLFYSRVMRAADYAVTDRADTAIYRDKL